jgi:arginase family enzyme
MVTKEHYLINVVCNGITAKDHIFKQFDHEVVDSMYRTCDENGHPLAYNFLYKYISTLPIGNGKTIITFSPDPSISGSTIAAMAEKYIQTEPDIDGSMKFTSKLKILMITSSSHLFTNYTEITVENLRNSMLSHLIGKKRSTYMGNKLVLSKDQFTLIGLNDNLLENAEREELENCDVSYFTLKQMRKKSIKSIIDAFNEKIGDDPLMVVFDLASTSYESAPCVSRFLKDGIKTSPDLLNGFNVGELRELFLSINCENLVACDITGYDFRLDNKERAYRITCETSKIPLFTLLKMKEKKLNIFNENSKFLIFRPIEQTSETDLGWFIMRGLSLEDRENIMKSIPDDIIIDFTIEDTDPDNTNNYQEQTVLITTTTIEEQNKKSFYDPDLKITDCVLYPAQKLYMTFELLNTPQNSIVE